MKNKKGSSIQSLALTALWMFSFLFVTAAFADTPQSAPAAAPGSPSPQAPAAESPTITLDFKEADINTVLRVMSLKSNVNIVAGPEVKGTVTIRLDNVPWEKALDVVLRTYGYVYEREGNIIRVTTRDNLASEPLLTQTFVLNYTKADEIQTAIQDMLTERGKIKVAERTNTIIVTDIPTNIYTMSQILKRLDKMTPQAYIDSKVLKTAVGLAENLGIEWKTGGTSNNLLSLTGSSRPTTFPFDPKQKSTSFVDEFSPQTNTSGSTSQQNTVQPKSFPSIGVSTASNPSNSTFSFGTLSFSSFNAILQMLKTYSDTKVISNPRIVVLNNQTAEIHVGDNIPLPKFETNSTTGRLVVSGFDYDKLKTGVSMKVIPHINSAEEILVDLQPSVNAQGSTISFNTDLSAPIINETTAKTQVLIRSGETIAIGGLLTDNVASTEAKVPYLGDIPIVGKIFRSKRQTAGSSNEKVETLFFVTVTMVDTEGQPAGGRTAGRTKSKKTTPKAAAQSGPEKVASTAPAQTETTIPQSKNPETPAAQNAVAAEKAPSESAVH